MSHQAGLLTTLHHIHICFPEQGGNMATTMGWGFLDFRHLFCFTLLINKACMYHNHIPLMYIFSSPANECWVSYSFKTVSDSGVCVRHSFQLAGTTILWLVGLNIGWDCLKSQCIVGLHYWWDFPPFAIDHHWLSPCTALTAGVWGQQVFRAVQGDCERVYQETDSSHAGLFVVVENTPPKLETLLKSNLLQTFLSKSAVWVVK